MLKEMSKKFEIKAVFFCHANQNIG